MNNKLRLPQALLITALGILLCLMTAYVPMLSILSMAVPVPYAIIGTLTDNKYSILSLIATFFILIFTVNPLYSVSVCIMSIVPGIFIGSAIRNNRKEDDFNKFIIDRAIELANRIEKAIGKSISGRDSVDTIRKFGVALI